VTPKITSFLPYFNRFKHNYNPNFLTNEILPFLFKKSSLGLYFSISTMKLVFFIIQKFTFGTPRMSFDCCGSHGQKEIRKEKEQGKNH
jgi:hypothetical protein